MTKKSSISSELEKADQQIQAFEENVQKMTLDRMNEAPAASTEPQTKLSSKEIEKSKDVYLKPERVIRAVEKFNERLREKYNFAKEYVQFIAENKEILGEAIELWTKPFPGVPAEFWKVPVNKAIWGPRYLAEQIKNCYYHRMRMEQSRITQVSDVGSMFGSMVVDSKIQRLDAEPVSTRKSVFMGASGF